VRDRRPNASGYLIAMLASNLPAEERALLDRVAAWPGFAWPELSAERLQALAAAEGIDFATALLYDRLRRSAEHGPFIAQLEALPEAHAPIAGAADVTLAVAPGGFYRERPDTGADGGFLLEQATWLGCRTAVLPLESFGTLDANARIVGDWLREKSGPIILVSLSKSGAEVRLALDRPEAAHTFAHVTAWVNLSGIVRGTPMVGWLLRRPLRCCVIRLLFRLRGYSFAALAQMQRGRAGLLELPLRLPPHLKVIHLFGFPLERHLSRPLSRRGHARIAPLGPNDGGANLLADLIGMPGTIYPVWGADHYLRPAWNLDSLLSRMFGELVRVAASAYKEKRS
jgi:hypothetical protein